ncbi:Crp/Fnr family transcriptional regulator [Kozakia baliensis]|nr:helix-turn-helix domain-containing protein [Kozakia baliensis]GBR24342.1 cAMP-binding transcriptional regulator [Kozakia baliensis NRIC 0488]GEL64548.1 nitrogen fixation regulation protein FixK [Kozakia baliensis]
MLMRTNDTVRAIGHCGQCEQCEHCSARSQSICSVIDQRDLHQLALHSQKIEIPSGRCFIEEGETARDFFIVTDGHAKLFNLLPDGRRQITGFADCGQFLGLASIENYAFSAEALTSLRVCRFSHIGMSLLKTQFPALERRLLEEASSELVRAQARMLLLGRKTARERLASFLLERQEVAPRSDVLILSMTRTDIADYLGLTIETVSRTLNAFRRDKLIEIDHITSIKLLNLTEIRLLADGEGF